MHVGILGCAVNYRFLLIAVFRTQGMGSNVNSCLLDCVIVDIERSVLLNNRLLGRSYTIVLVA